MAANLPRVKRPLRSEEGSITLEASMVMPIIFVLTVVIVVFAVWILNRSLSYYIAASESSRAAFAWAHSSADLQTGAYPAGAYDGLYWRLTDDAALAGLFGWGSDSGGSIKVDVGSSETSASSLTETKLYKTTERLTEWSEGAALYHNQLWKKTVTVEGGGSFLPVSLPGLPEEAANFEVLALATEPAEWVRTFELIRYYRNKFKEQGKGSESYRQKASDVLKSRKSMAQGKK